MKVIDTYSKYHGKIDLAKLIPRVKPLWVEERERDKERINPFHRKQTLKYIDLLERKIVKPKRKLPKEFKTILEISSRAPECPFPFVLDVNGGGRCYDCIYCFTKFTESSIYSSWFDNYDAKRARWASPETVRKILDDVLKARGVEPISREHNYCGNSFCGSLSDDATLKKAAAQRIPLRFGTRSENFLPEEKLKGSSFEALKVIKDHEYPVIINTKSTLPSEGRYLKLISELDKVVVQITITHCDDGISKKLEPSAPVSSKRFEAIKKLNECGIKAYPRLEPLMEFVNADPEHLKTYAEKTVEAGAEYVLLDSYSYFVNPEKIRESFYLSGFDFDRMFEATSEYQILGSYVIEKACYYFKKAGLQTGTFNFHTLPWNDDKVCCGFSEHLGGNWNRYNVNSAIKNEILEGSITFEEFDEKYYGYELNPALRQRVENIWNKKVETPWEMEWCEGVFVSGGEPNNLEYSFNPRRIDEGYENLVKILRR